jgi:hypothetical protein
LKAFQDEYLEAQRLAELDAEEEAIAVMVAMLAAS